MDQPHEQNNPLRQQSSVLSDASFGSNSTMVASPDLPTIHRPGYRREPSVVEQIDPHSTSSICSQSGDQDQGLGISNLGDQKHTSVSSVPVESKDSPGIPGSAKAFLSPSPARPGSRFDRNTFVRCESVKSEDSYNPPTSTPRQPFSADSDTEVLLHDKDSFACKATKPPATGRGNPLAISLLILSLYSTVFAGIWLFIAISAPKYGHTITTLGFITPQHASVLCAAFAKSIELTFVTIVVSFIGQVLSRRALGDRKAVTIAEMSMRSWVLQPGTMITHWQSVRCAGVSFLGAIALLAALMAIFYTTASDALVAPKLKVGKHEDKLLFGKVATSFANTFTVTNRCTTPIQVKDDPDYSGTTCIQLQHSGEAYHNYMQYLGLWSDHISTGNLSSDLGKRPEPVAMLYDNTTVHGSWIHIQNMTDLSKDFSRITNNITMAMPHSGVFQAARDPVNDIMQPNDLSGLGEYDIRASVPSPVVNVLCAELSRDDLKPMIYTEWLDFNGTWPNTTTWPQDFNLTLPSSAKNTNVDELFNFDDNQVHPIFPKLPEPYNTVFNASNRWGPQAVYLLATSASSRYTLCSIRTALTANCSTRYHSSGSGGSLNATCNPTDKLSYDQSRPEAPHGVWVKDWIDVASEWGKALSLNDGITDGKSSNARLLTQLIPKTDKLEESMPSISEALAVLAGNTLLLSALDSPFIHYWNYSDVMTLKEPQYQAFKATLQTAAYQSGGNQNGQRIFYVVLAAVFVANICCLVYFIISGGMVTDFIEPQNLFCLSLLSPPNNVLEGTCASGPDKDHFATRWNIKLDTERDHFWLDGRRGVSKKGLLSQSKNGYEMEGSPAAMMYNKIRQNRTSRL